MQALIRYLKSDSFPVHVIAATFVVGPIAALLNR